jgi:septum formation protein
VPPYDWVYYSPAFILQPLHGKNQSEGVLESPDMFPAEQAKLRLYLASNSPRRKELLSLIKLEYNLLPAQVDETPLPDEDGIKYVQRIAKSKVFSAATQVGGQGVIVAADTAVIDHRTDGKSQILGKPEDAFDAAEMLYRLRGHVHQVLTAVSILRKDDGALRFELCTTDVPMRNYTEQEIEAYVSTGDPLDKAGAYAIQHAGFHPVENLTGCYANVMGLPLCHLTRSISRLGIDPKVDVPQTCQAALGYDCCVYRDILSEKTLGNALP